MLTALITRLFSSPPFSRENTEFVEFPFAAVRFSGNSPEG